jgi:hypothetical protein
MDEPGFMYARAIAAGLGVALVAGVAAGSQSGTPLLTFGSIVVPCAVGLFLVLLIAFTVNRRQRTH